MQTVSLLYAVAGLLLLLAPAPLAAASCCGGASATDPFVLPKWKKAMAGALFQVETDVDQRNGDGRRLRSTAWRSHTQRLVAGGAARLHRDLQAAASLPLVGRRVTVGQRSAGGIHVGDIGLQFRYELMDEETCVIVPFRTLSWRELKPSIHWTLKQTMPSGRSPGQAGDPLGASVTGQGYWITETGIDLTKIWGLIGNSLELGGGWQRASRAEGGSSTATRLNLGASLLIYPAFQRFIGLNVSHRQQRWHDAASSRRSSTSLGLIGSYVLQKSGFWLRGSLSSTGLVQGRNSPVGLQANLFVARLF